MRTSSFFVASAVVVVAAGGLVACANQSENIRAFVAPDFRRIDDTRLQDAMWRLGNGVQNLNDLFLPEAAVADADREAAVVEVLDGMAEAAKSVNKPGQKAQHQNIAMNIDKLIEDIAIARAAALEHNLAPAQALPLTCLACHQGEAGGAQK